MCSKHVNAEASQTRKRSREIILRFFATKSKLSKTVGAGKEDGNLENIFFFYHFLLILFPSLPLFCLLHQLSLQDCWLHKANGGMVLLTFFMCRIALFPYMYWVYGQHYGIPLYSVPFHLPLSANVGNSCILAPQVYWFVLLCRKGYRLYRRSRMQDSSPVATVTDNSKDD